MTIATKLLVILAIIAGCALAWWLIDNFCKAFDILTNDKE